MRGQTVRWLSVLAFVAFLAPSISAQAVTTAQNQTIRISGIFSGTLFAQDGDFQLGNGQKAQYVTAERDEWVHGGDVRNMRLNLGLTGPEIRRGWRANATFEIDFFGAFAGGGTFGDEQPQPRLRLAYVEMTDGRTTWRFGQDWSLTLGNIPQSTSHIGFPLGWGPGGFIGWRFTQIKLIKTLSGPRAPTTTRLQLAVLNGSWSDEPGGADNQFNAGERTLLPQIEGRLDFSTARWSAYVVAHVDAKDSVTPPAAGTEITSWAVQGGFSTTRGDLTFHGNAHVGRAMGHHFAQIIQLGDIGGWGAWGQVGYNLSPRWSLWGYYGTERPTEDDIRDPTITVTEASGPTIAVANRRLKSWLFVPMIRYRSGSYSAGVEWLHSELELESGARLAGNQIAASVRYDF